MTLKAQDSLELLEKEHITLAWKEERPIMKKKGILRIAVLLTGASFMLLGCFRGELPVVFGKAITVCLECIGLG